MRNFAAALLVAFVALASFAAPAPAVASPGVQIKANQVFLLDFFNFRIRKVEWMPATSSLVNNAVGSDAGRGAIVLTIEVRNASDDARGLPSPAIQVMMKSGEQTTAEGRTAYDANGHEINGDYQSGDGPTVKYVIPDVAKPSASNPVTKIVFTPSYSGDTGPSIFRLIQPQVTISH